MDLQELVLFQVGKEAIDLLGKMLQKDPAMRISAEEALRHEYLSEDDCNIDDDENDSDSSTIPKIPIIRKKQMNTKTEIIHVKQHPTKKLNKKFQTSDFQDDDGTEQKTLHTKNNPSFGKEMTENALGFTIPKTAILNTDFLMSPGRLLHTLQTDSDANSKTLITYK